MLTIRDAQMEALARGRLIEFVVRHVNRFFPGQCRALGKAGTLDAVRKGIERAEAHGFSRLSDQCSYVDLVFAFGHRFDRDQAWAVAVFVDPAPIAPPERMERLLDAAHDYVAELAGGTA
jgi:hypothetical protein